MEYSYIKFQTHGKKQPHIGEYTHKGTNHNPALLYIPGNVFTNNTQSHAVFCVKKPIIK